MNDYTPVDCRGTAVGGARASSRLFPLARALSLGCGLWLTGAAGEAMTVAPPTFDDLVAESAQVVRVEVIATTSQLETRAEGAVIHTQVRCRALRSLKGATGDPEFTLTFQGGEVGDLCMVVPGMPRFVAGDRCILFLSPNASRFCPLVAAQHGSYRIVADEVTGAERVLRDNREPLTNIAEVVRPVHDPDRRGALQMPVARALEVSVFERLITDKVSEQATHAREH